MLIYQEQLQRIAEAATAKEYKEPEGLFLWLFFYSSFSRSSALA